MKLTVVHRTRYAYTDLVTTSHHLAYLVPRDDARQRCVGHELTITPPPRAQRTRIDCFGNRCLHFNLIEPHRALEVTARSTVETQPLPDLDLRAGPSWENVRDRVRTDRRRDLLDAYQFVFPSSQVPDSPAHRDFAADCFAPGRPILETVAALVDRIYTQFTYDKAATSVSTPLADVFRKQRGVCQDFAHVAIAVLRARGLPARYVSGYLMTRPPEGRPRLVGADASHAWISVFVPDAGWFDFDPTNNVMPSDEHVTVACGRDFSDVAPLRGVILGGGRHELSVSVDVAPW